MIISDVCEYNTSLYYKVILEDSKQNAEILAEIDSINCSVRFYQIHMNTTGIFNFSVTVIAVNAAGESRSATHNVSIGKLSAFVSMYM